MSPPLKSPSESTVAQKRSNKFAKFLGRSRNASLSSIGESDALSVVSSSQAPSLSEQTLIQSTPGTSFSFPSNPSSPKFKQGFGSDATEQIDPESPRFLQKVSSRHREAAESLQRSTSILQRAVWIAKDREAYKSAVATITGSNDLIESLLRSHVLRAIDRKLNQSQREVLEKPTIPDKLPEHELRCTQSLARLHDALSFVPFEHKFPDKVDYSLRIACDHSVTRESVSTSFPDLPLRNDSNVFLLQAQSTEKQPRDSKLLLVEDSNISSRIQAKCEPFEHRADLHPRNSPSYIDRVFQDTTSWTEYATLGDLVNAEEMKPGIKARLALAALLANSHLHTSSIPNQAGNTRLHNFRFYDLSSEAATCSPSDIAENEDLLLNIYHFCNLGKPQEKSSTRFLGARVNPRSNFDTSVIDLGLLLYQIGCWKRYRSDVLGNNREKLKEDIYGDIHELYRQTGLRFAETVQNCLEWDRHLPRQLMTNLEYFYRDIVTPLLELKTTVKRSSAHAG